MAKTLSKTGITTDQAITAAHVTQSIDAFTGVKAYDTYVGVSNVATYRTPKNPDDGSLSLGSVITKLTAEMFSFTSATGSVEFSTSNPIKNPVDLSFQYKFY